MMSKYLMFVSIFFLMACNSIDKNNMSSIKKNDSIHIEDGANTKGMTLKVINNQKNSHVIQNDAININERGSIRIGN